MSAPCSRLSRFRSSRPLPLILTGRLARRQQGASLIAVIFVMTALLLLGGLMTHLLVSSTEETINEWYSAQALYAAESGVEWSIYNGGANANDQDIGSGSAWFTVTVNATAYDGGKTLYTITSIGEAGGSAANPRTQRRISVTYLE